MYVTGCVAGEPPPPAPGDADDQQMYIYAGNVFCIHVLSQITHSHISLISFDQMQPINLWFATHIIAFYLKSEVCLFRPGIAGHL